MAKSGGTSSISGPGIGGSSEIGAVSVGVYVADYTQAGFARVKAEAVAAGTEIGAAGATAGKKYGDGLVGGTVGAAKGLRGAVKTILKTAGAALLVPALAEHSFEFGKKIGEYLFGERQSAEIIKRAEEQAEKITKEYEKAVSAKFDDLVKNLEGSGRKVDVASLLNRQKESSQATEKLPGLQKELNALLREQSGLEFDIANSPDKNDVVKRQIRLNELLEKKRDTTDAIMRMTAQQKDYEELISALTKESAENIKAKLEALKDIFIEQRRQEAVKGASIDSTAVDISRLRQLGEIGFRQRFPAMPGSGAAN